MNPRERVWSALEGREVDRPPVSFWGHIYDRESTATDLVQATVEFQREYGWDYVKLNPRKSYFVEDWGVRYAYSGRRAEKPKLIEWPIHDVTDWSRLRPLAPDRGAYGEQLDAVRALKRALPKDVPFVQTVFLPLGVAGEMVEKPPTVRAARNAGRSSSVRNASIRLPSGNGMEYHHPSDVASTSVRPGHRGALADGCQRMEAHARRSSLTRDAPSALRATCAPRPLASTITRAEKSLVPSEVRTRTSDPPAPIGVMRSTVQGRKSIAPRSSASCRSRASNCARSKCQPAPFGSKIKSVSPGTAVPQTEMVP